VIRSPQRAFPIEIKAIARMVDIVLFWFPAAALAQRE
jgi:hypothetical protein